MQFSPCACSQGNAPRSFSDALRKSFQGKCLRFPTSGIDRILGVRMLALRGSLSYNGNTQRMVRCKQEERP